MIYSGHLNPRTRQNYRLVMKLVAVFLSLLFLGVNQALFAAEATQHTSRKDTKDHLLLKNNLKQAKSGDYLVTEHGKNYTILAIKGLDKEGLKIEEISVPAVSIKGQRSNGSSPFSWKSWLNSGAKGNTCRILYHIDLEEGVIKQAFSFSKNEWISMPQSQNFFSTLLNLQLSMVKDEERRKIGPPPTDGTPDRRKVWQPPLIIDGKAVANVSFDVLRTRWPADGGELSGKIIEVYLPKESAKYPSYFPYWLQVMGVIGKANLRIVDSGNLEKMKL